MNNPRTANYILTKDKYYSDGWNVVLRPKSDLSEEQDYFRDKISLVTRWESANNVKLYIADGYHSVMYINLRGLDQSDNGDIFPIEGIEDINSETNVLLDPITIMDITKDGRIPYVKV